MINVVNKCWRSRLVHYFFLKDNHFSFDINRELLKKLCFKGVSIQIKKNIYKNYIQMISTNEFLSTKFTYK